MNYRRMQLCARALIFDMLPVFEYHESIRFLDVVAMEEQSASLRKSAGISSAVGGLEASRMSNAHIC